MPTSPRALDPVRAERCGIGYAGRCGTGYAGRCGTGYAGRCGTGYAGRCEHRPLQVIILPARPPLVKHNTRGSRI